MIIQAGRAELYSIAIDTHVLHFEFVPELIEKFADPGSRPVLLKNNTCAEYFWLTSSPYNINISSYKGINMVGNCPVSRPVLMSFHQSEFDCLWSIVGLNVEIPIIQ